MSTRVQREISWCEHHHVVSSRANVATPKSQRAYFDHLPAVRMRPRSQAGSGPRPSSSQHVLDEGGNPVQIILSYAPPDDGVCLGPSRSTLPWQNTPSVLRDGEFSDELLLSTSGCDNLVDHEEHLHKRYKQFPQFWTRTKWPHCLWSPAGATCAGQPSPPKLSTAALRAAGMYCRLETIPHSDGVSEVASAGVSSPPQPSSPSRLPPASARPELADLLKAANRFKGRDDSGAPDRPEMLSKDVMVLGRKTTSRSNTGGGNRPNAQLIHEGINSIQHTEDDMVQLDKFSEFQSFLGWAHTKHTHLVRLWHKLDRDGSMSLHKAEFMTGMKKLNYPGHLDRLWTSFDRDTTGTVSFIEFAPEAALDLARFKRWMYKTFGSAKGLFIAMDTDRSGSITFTEFEKACPELGLPERLQHSLKTLFLLLDHEEGMNQLAISEDELRFLEVWKPPAYLWEEPNETARRKFQDALVAKHNGNPLLAWRRALDKDSSMRVSYEEFLVQCKYLAKHGIPEAAPECGVTALYASLDNDRSGWFNIRDWDSNLFDLLRQFCLWVRGKYGSGSHFVKAVEAMDDGTKDKAIGISYSKFVNAVKPLGLSYTQRTRLFEGLQLPTRRNEGKSGRLYVQDLVFLQSWDPDWEVKEDDVWSRLAGKHMDISRKGLNED